MYMLKLLKNNSLYNKYVPIRILIDLPFKLLLTAG